MTFINVLLIGFYFLFFLKSNLKFCEKMKEQEIKSSFIRLKAYSKTEVADLYEISTKTLKTWLTPLEKELGPRIGRFYSPRQIEIIFKEYGIPKLLYYN